MKKSIIAIAAILSIALFQSCTSGNSQANNMQKPEPEMKIILASDVAELKTVSENANSVNYQNMQDAYKGETTASAKYAAYSKKAEEEGYFEIALLFATASKSEKIHASNHRVVLEESGQTVPVIVPEFTVKSTNENLQDAIKGESYEINTMYPEFMVNANKANNQFALISLNYAYKTEQKHLPLYQKALAALESDNVKSLPTVYYLCPTCGNTYDTNAPSRCGISMTSSEKFIKITTLDS